MTDASLYIVVVANLYDCVQFELEWNDRKKLAVLLVQVCIELDLRGKEASDTTTELVGKSKLRAFT